MRTGRPSTYTKEIADRVCNELSEGASLVAICSVADMPHPSTIYDWLKANPDFADRYTSAREAQAEFMAAEIIEISDDGSRDYKPGPEGQYVPDQDHIQRSKLRVESRKWIAAKLKPKVYGDRQQIDLTGSLVISEMSEEDLMAELTELVATGVIKALPAPADDNEDLL